MKKKKVLLKIRFFHMNKLNESMVDQSNLQLNLEVEQDKEIFFKVIKKAINYVKDGKIVTFGITPNKPETGYGYIEIGDNYQNMKNMGIAIKRFTEKPDYKTALKFLEDQSFTWNSGIFMFKASTIIEEINYF